MPNPPVVVFDACVFYPALSRNLMVQLATTALFRARWTDVIHDEWTRALLRDKPDIAPAVLGDQRRRINQAVPDCLVTGFEHLIDRLALPDASDRHVLAAAIHAGADVILTTNLKDFPEAVLLPRGVRPVHPDQFVVGLLGDDPRTVCASVRILRRRLKAPPYSAEDLVRLFREQGFPRAASELEQRLADL